MLNYHFIYHNKVIYIYTMVIGNSNNAYLFYTPKITIQYVF